MCRKNSIFKTFHVLMYISAPATYKIKCIFFFILSMQKFANLAKNS